MLPGAPVPTAQRTAPATTVPTEVPATAEPVQTLLPQKQVISIWLPPQFDPAADTPAAKLLQSRLDAFSAAHANVSVTVRVKAAQGVGGLLESLRATKEAAPDVLPSMVLLDFADLQEAAREGLIKPVVLPPQPADKPVWYPFAQEMVLVDQTTYGVPFAGDALTLVYRTVNGSPRQPEVWQDVFDHNELVLFPAEDEQALTPLAVYLSAGGHLRNDAGRPSLQPDILTAALQVFRNGAVRGAFTSTVTTLSTLGQSWQGFAHSEAKWSLAWSSDYLLNMPENTRISRLPSAGARSVTLMNGWAFAVTEDNAAWREQCLKLALYLTEPEFLAEWSKAAGAIPSRPDALALWADSEVKSSLISIMEAAEIMPSADLLQTVSSPLKSALLDVLSNKAESELAAATAVEKIGNP